MIDDTEEGLELPPLELVQTEEEKVEDLIEDDALKVEFEKAIERQAEERAASPFIAAAQTHAMIWNGFAESLREVTSADLKRIILYLCGYPFYLKELGVEEKKKNVIGVAYRASKLIEAKSAMILCKAIEQEARVAKALDEQEALIQPLDPANFVGREVNAEPLTAEMIDDAVEIAIENSLNTK